MTKIRVSNLAEKLGLETREVLSRLKDIGVHAKTATSLVEEDVVKRLTAPQAKENGPDEVRVTTNIIRRRAKVAPASEESPAGAVEMHEERPLEPVISVPPGAPVVTMTEAVPAPLVAAAPDAVPAAESKSAADVRIPETVLEPAAIEKPKAPLQHDKPSANQARILGRMEIPGVTNRQTRVVKRDGSEEPTPAPRQADTSQRRPAPAAGAPSHNGAPRHAASSGAPTA